MSVPGWYSEWADAHRLAFLLGADWLDAAWASSRRAAG